VLLSPPAAPTCPFLQRLCCQGSVFCLCLPVSKSLQRGTGPQVTIVQPRLRILVTQPYLQYTSTVAGWLDTWVTLTAPPTAPLGGVLARTLPEALAS
jgi:hypothetical protein